MNPQDWALLAAFGTGIALVAVVVVRAGRPRPVAEDLRDDDPLDYLAPPPPNVLYFTDRVVLEAIAAGQQDKALLASHAGIGRLAVDRVLARLEARGAVAFAGGRLVVTHPDYVTVDTFPVAVAVAREGSVFDWERRNGERGESPVVGGSADIPVDAVSFTLRAPADEGVQAPLARVVLDDGLAR